MKIRSCISLLALITAAVAALAWSGFSSAAKGQSDSPSSTFQANANTLGAIPDGGAACGPTIITPLDVTFTVSGVAGAPASVAVSVTFGQPNHTFMGDITATLIAPNNTQFVLFGRTGATTATGTGDGTDLGGTYIFSDN